MQAESLLDPKYMGGLNASKGFRFETAYILNRIQCWLSADVESFQQETWSDVELFLASGGRQLIQIKDHTLTPAELAEMLDDFSVREHAFKYEQYVIASAGLSKSVDKLARQLERYRSLTRHNEDERVNVGRIIESTLRKLNLGRHHKLVLEKVFFDSNIASLRDEEFCRNSFLGGLVSSYPISIQGAKQIFLQTAEMLNQSHSKSVKLSMLGNALVQAELENQEASLSSFRLIRKQFLDSIQKDSGTTFFYSGAAPTWSDILKGLDIPRDVASVITPILKERKGSIFVPIVAEAGEGKSTLLRRLAVDLAYENKPVLFHDGSATTADFKEVQRIAHITQECVYVFFDEVAKIQNLKGFLQSIAELPVSVMIVGAARPYEMTAVRSAYPVNMRVARDDARRSEYSLKGLSDREIELLVGHLLEAKILCLPAGVGLSLAAEAIKERTDRKLLVLAIELTQGAKVQDIIRDEIERVRQKGERLLSVYRYVCLTASIDSFITVSMIEELVHNKNVRLDVTSELPGLVTIEADKLYPRHNRIGEIVTEVLFQNQDDERGDALCKIISMAFARGELDVIRSATRVSRSVPASQKIKVVNHLVDELYRNGEIELIEHVIEEFQWANKSTELFLEFLTANTPFLWTRLIFPDGPYLDWKRIEEAYELPFRALPLCGAIAQASSIEQSYDRAMKWAGIFGLAAWNVRVQTPFLIAITSKMYDVLETRYPDKECEICFAHAEFLSQQWQEKEAIPLYQRVLRRRPEYADAHAGLSLAFYMAGEYYCALHHFRAAMRINPQSLFRVANESIFEEMTERVLELEEYIEYKKAVLKQNFKVGRGHQHLISIFPTVLVNLRKDERYNPDYGSTFINRMDFGEQAEQRQIAELDNLLRNLPTMTPAERRNLETMIDDSFGDLRDEIAKNG
jgi:tetratricopeptide (TPR) repeat protein